MSKINFGAGPAKLPEEVLKEASEAIIDYNRSGLSILEIPHRGQLFASILEECNALVKELCGITDDYHVLWLQGGRLQFSMVPMNFLGADEEAGYIDSGHWSAEAIENAALYGKATVLATSRADKYEHLPPFPKNIPEHLQYVHFTTNNTIYGTQWQDIPSCNSTLIADMSSDILSCERDYSRYSLFYAVVQKNIGAAGVTLVVIHKSMLERTRRTLPPMLDYKAQVKGNSLLNTPPVFAIYSSLLMLRWTKKQSLTYIYRQNKEKADLLYNEIERNTLFSPVVSNKTDRSMMNACFRAKDPETEKAFSAFCKQHHIEGVDGHRSVGGFRASLYNAVSLEDTKQLVAVMQQFEQIHL